MDDEFKVLDNNVEVFKRMFNKSLCIVYMSDGMWKLFVEFKSGKNDDYVLLDDTNYRYDVNDSERKS